MATPGARSHRDRRLHLRTGRRIATLASVTSTARAARAASPGSRRCSWRMLRLRLPPSWRLARSPRPGPATRRPRRAATRR
eukprot:8339834-Pyramimonas_sp.AAC.1